MNKILVVLLICLGINFTNSHAQKRILFVASNQDFYGNTKIATSNHFQEIIVPYDIFTKAGYTVDFLSPKGGAIPVGYINTSDTLQKKYLYDGWFMDKLEHTLKPTEISAGDYVAILYTGGGAAMFGVAEDKTIQEIATKIYKGNGIVSAICHGTAGLAFLKDENGSSLYKDRKITGYPDQFENKEAEYYQTFPFAINKAIQNNQGNFVYADQGGGGFYVVDGRFVTGQDPSSASKMAVEIVKLLNTSLKSTHALVKTDLDQVKEILLHYIEGTANGEPERLRKAFHPNFNLYTVVNDTLWTRSGERYISNTKAGVKNNRIGRIISIDIEKDAAIAKAEIVVPNLRTFADYFLMLKYQGAWKIVHKSYSWRDLAKKENTQ